MPCFSCSNERCEHGLASLYRTDAPEADAHKTLKHAAVARAALTYNNSSMTFYMSEESTYVIHHGVTAMQNTGMHVCVRSTHRRTGISCFITISSHSNCSSAQSGWILTRLLGTLSVGGGLSVSRADKSHLGLESSKPRNQWSQSHVQDLNSPLLMWLISQRSYIRK